MRIAKLLGWGKAGGGKCYEKPVIVMCNTQQRTIVGLCMSRFTSSYNIMPKVFEKLRCKRIDIAIEK